MTTFVTLVELYERQGDYLRCGLNSGLFGELNKGLSFATLHRAENLELVCNGGGISPLEIYFLESLFTDYRPSRIFAIGNAFGWSTLALSIIVPEARTICIDACQDAGYEEGRRITNLIALKEGLNASVVKGISPTDVETIIKAEFNAPIDFAFIDGWHTNEQILADFLACRRLASPDCVYLFHDVVNMELFDGFDAVLAHDGNITGKVLMRTTSGMAIAFPTAMTEIFEKVVTAFSQDNKLLADLPQPQAPHVRKAGLMAEN